MTRAAVIFLMIVSVAALPGAQAPVERLDDETIGRIRDEGLNRSQVMDHISWLADVYGPRLTGTPGCQALVAPAGPASAILAARCGCRYAHSGL